MPYTITSWEDRPNLGGPKFSATLGDDEYRASGINYEFSSTTASPHKFHEVIIWKNDEEVAYRKDTANVIPVFHDYLRGEGIDV
jgi:hypothetical protein